MKDVTALSTEAEAGMRAIAAKHPGSWPFWLDLEGLFATLDREREAVAALLTAAKALLDEFPERDRPETPRGKAIERLRAAVRGLGS